MCGIVGYISKTKKLYPAEKAHFMRFALALDTLRGFDSTGIMMLGGNFHVDVKKTTMPGDRYVNSAQWRKHYKTGWACVGHNRAATVGKSTLKNAHPFQDGPITLVHNGTLWAAGTTLPKHNPELEVDSAQIAHNLAEHKPEEAVEVIEELDGAYALVWFDERDKSINMCRNDERPLAFTINYDKDILWFMSDPAHLQIINKSMQGRTQAVGRSIYKLESKRLLKWKKGDLVPEVTEFSPFTYARRQAKQRQHEASSDSAFTKATNKWKEALESRKKSGGGASKSSAGYTGARVHLGGMLRKVPEPMLEALKKEYDLSPDNYMQFTPDSTTPFGKDNMAFGEVNYPEWGDSRWKAVVIDVTTLQCNAYMDQDWLVQPIGIAHPWDDKSTCPAILCLMIHADWDGYYDRNLKEALEAAKKHEAQAAPKVVTQSESNNLKEGWVEGPDSILMSYGTVRPALERGCISCGSNLTVEALPECQWRNGGVDLLCGDCVEDFEKGVPPYNVH